MNQKDLIINEKMLKDFLKFLLGVESIEEGINFDKIITLYESKLLKEGFYKW